MGHPLSRYDVSRRDQLDRALREVKLSVDELFRIARDECADSGLSEPARALALLCWRADAATSDIALSLLQSCDSRDQRVAVEYFLGARHVSSRARGLVRCHLERLLKSEDARVVDRVLVLATTVRDPGEALEILRKCASSVHEDVRARVAAELLEVAVEAGGVCEGDWKLFTELAKDPSAGVRRTAFYEAAEYVSVIPPRDRAVLVALAGAEGSTTARDAADLLVRSVAASGE